MKTIFKTESVTFSVDFNEAQAAKEIIQQLPLESTVSTWGQEIYFDIGFKASASDATMEIDAGDVAYWPQGKCLCVFFGPTPVSIDLKPVPASPVVIIGKVSENYSDLKNIKLGEKISVYLAGI